MQVYMDQRAFSSLTGPEVVAMGNMHCLLSETNVDELSAVAIKLVFHNNLLVLIGVCS